MKSVAEIVDKFGRDKGQLVSILQDIQAEYRYLPKDALVEVSQILDLPLSQVYSVATFFKAFSLEPRGKHQINVCIGTACHVRGAMRIVDSLKREIGVEPGQTTTDGKFSFEEVRCFGSCALAPVMVVDEEVYGNITTTKAKEILDKTK